MAYRYTRIDGAESIAPDVETLWHELKGGRILTDTPVLDESVGVTLKAGALIAVHRRGGSPADAVADAAFPTPAAPPAASAVIEAPSAPAKRSGSWRIAAYYGLVVLMGIVPIALLDFLGMDAYRIGEHVGRGMFFLPIVWLVARMIAGTGTERRAIRVAWSVYVLWFVYMMLPVPFIHARNEQVVETRQALKAMAASGRQALAEIESDTKAMATSSTAANSPAASPIAPVTNPATIPTATPTAAPPVVAPPVVAPVPSSAAPLDGKSLMGRIVPVIQRFQRDNVKEAKRFEVALAALQLEDVMLPKTLASAQGLADNRRKLDGYLAELSTQIQRDKALEARLRQEILTVLGEETASTRSFMRGFDESRAKARPAYDAAATSQKTMIASLRALNDFMAARLGKVRLDEREDKLVFRTDAEVIEYQRLVNEVDKAADRVEAASNALMKQQREKLEAVEAGARDDK